MKNEISLIIKTDNNDHFKNLIVQLNRFLKENGNAYEVFLYGNIDHSLKELSLVWPINIIDMDSSNTMDIINSTSYSNVAIIDATLGFSPECIVSLLKKLDMNDIVITQRQYLDNKNIAKKIISDIFSSINSALFGLKHDLQPEIIVFNKKIVNHIQSNLDKKNFCRDFIIRSFQIGSKIAVVPLAYNPAKRGISKSNNIINLLNIMKTYIHLIIYPVQPIIVKNSPPEDLEISYQKTRFKPYTKLPFKDSAIQTISSPQIIFIAALVLLILMIFLINWHTGLVLMITFLTSLYFGDLLFNLFLIIRSVRENPEIKVSHHEIQSINDWPRYTIICPLYKEWPVLPQFIRAIDLLDYPRNKLQVILVLEEDDTKSINEINKIPLPYYFEKFIVPANLPKTKPKACNYAFLKAKGDYIVVYDAEDIPEPDQLKKAVVAFRKVAMSKIACLQAKLTFYNIEQNLLTRLFTLEYALWFDLILTGLHSIEAPIPLGGTSNHFKKETLDLLQGWDPFNVTEDCDLGMRLFKYGYKTKMLDSITNEEANSDFFGWFRQRSRWVKGYIQTYLVHMRNPKEFINSWATPHLLTFQLVVGGKVLSMWINPFLWLITFVYFSFRSRFGAFIESLYLLPIFYIGVISLVFGNFLYFYYYMVAAAKKDKWSLIIYAFFAPLYWIMMSVAAWIALIQIFTKPFYWEKTNHGLHLKSYPLNP